MIRIGTKPNKTIQKNSNFTYKLDVFHDKLIQKYMDSDHISTNIYGFEILSNSEIYTFTPTLDRLEYSIVEQDLSTYFNSNTLQLYEIQMKNPLFLPIYNKFQQSLIEQIFNIQQSYPVLIQILIQKINKWRDNAISQYEEFLKGNDYPSENRILRNTQSKIINVLNKFANFQVKRKPIQDVEDKILSDNFKIEIRFAIEDNEGEFELTINKFLKQYDYYNQLELVKIYDVDSQIQLIKNRQMKSYTLNQLSTSEINSLFSSDKSDITPKQEVMITSNRKSQQTSNPEQYNHLLDVLPKYEKQSNDIDNEIVDRLIQSFKRTKITNKLIKIGEVARGATLQKVTLKIPNDIVYTNIEKNLKNIQATLGNDAISMEISDTPDSVDFYIPCSEREVVYLRNVLESDEFIEQVTELTLPLILGEDSIGKPLLSDLAELKHILIAGATGSGKSVFLNALILTMIMYKEPGELKLILIDPKKVELVPFSKYPQVTFVDDMNKATNTFETLINEMNKRYDTFASKGCRNIAQYNSKLDIKVPYLVCIVDELSDLMDTHGNEIESHIIRLGQKARAAGIHLILCTQKPSVDVITSRIKSNLPSAISFRLKAQSDYRTVFGKGIPYHLLGKGDGVAMLEGNSKEFIRFQSPVIDLDDNTTVDIIDKIADTYEGIQHEPIKIIETEEPIDKLKRIIASTGETRISELQKEMKIRINLVSELMKQLVTEEWVIKEGKGYKIIVSENELDKWREVAEQ